MEKVHQKAFYHGTVRRINNVVGTLINNLAVQRLDENGDVLQTIRVPVSYASKQHWVYRLKKDIDRTIADDVETSIVLPRITFILTGFAYDPDRSLNNVNKVIREVELEDGSEIRKWQFAPQPYTLSFRVTAFARNMDDLMQITEQILPYFRPELTVRVAEVGEIASGEEVYNDVVIAMSGDPVFTDNFERGFEGSDIVSMELDITARTHLWGPVRSQKIILKSIVDIDQFDPYAPLTRVTVEANPGETEDIENSTTTIEDK